MNVRVRAARDGAEYIKSVLNATEPEIPFEGILAGPKHLNELPNADEMCGGIDDNLHFPMDVGNLLALGVTGIVATARTNANSMDFERKMMLYSIADVFEGIAAFIQRHAEKVETLMAGAPSGDRNRLGSIAENCRFLSQGPPETFAQAVQLFWFVHCARSRGQYGSTIGRLDQHLYPFYKADLDAGGLSRKEALEILCELWRNLNIQVDHPVLGLLNVIVGGQDETGNDATNEVSFLILEAAMIVRDTNPFVSVRIHENTPRAFVDRVADLHLVGHGQGTVYNDKVVIPSLLDYGVPPELARLYANDGCNEVTIDGRSTVALYAVDALKSLEFALFNGKECPPARRRPTRNCTAEEEPGDNSSLAQPGIESGFLDDSSSFEDVVEVFFIQWFRQIDTLLAPQMEILRERSGSLVTAPIVSGTFASVLRTGLDPLRGGVDVPEQMLFLNSIPTVGDCLAAIRTVVFEQNVCTLTELREALAADWEGHESLRQCCRNAPKFGNDDDSVDMLVADIVCRSAGHVKEFSVHVPFGVWPCLFNHTFLAVAQSCGATADGRRWMDPVAEHFSPTPGSAMSGPTAVLRSASKSPLRDCVGVALVQVGLSRSTVPANAEGRALITNLIRSAFAMGISQMNIAIYDIEQLKDAQAHPDKYPDLIVRVWGFSARFVSLSKEMQDHIIARSVG